MERFALDETKAAEWLAASVAAYDSGTHDESTPPEQHPEIGGDYDPGTDERATANLVYAAGYAGVITGPGDLLYDVTSDDESLGYAWLVYLGGPHAPKLSSGWQETRHLAGARELYGAEAALAVLREAVSEANRMLDDFDAYVAAQGTGTDPHAGIDPADYCTTETPCPVRAREGGLPCGH